MRKSLFFFCFLALPVFCFPFFSSERCSQVLKAACTQNRPIVAVFLGEDGCPWSQKIEKELFNSPFFTEAVGSEALVWLIALSRNVEGSTLSEQYKIVRFPSILLLDPAGKEFARLDYDASEPSEFCARILSLIHGFNDVCRAVDRGLGHFDEDTLQILYKQACCLSPSCFAQVILHQGLKKEKKTFFHLEKYALLLQRVKLRNKEVLKLKKELLARDPHNQWGTAYKMALCEFEKKKRTPLKKKDPVEKPLGPLIRYLDQFGEEDPEHRWQLELMIAEFLFEKRSLKTAFEYLKKAKEHAPQEARPQVLKTIAYMKDKL